MKIQLLVAGLALVVSVALFLIPPSGASSNRDDFPGRRQGGGTHWHLPTDTAW